MSRPTGDYATRTAHPHWAEPENQRNGSCVETLAAVIEDLKQDINNLKRDIAELGSESGKNVKSITRLCNIMSGLQDQHKEMLRDYDDAKLRIVELESELAAVRAVNRKTSKKAKSTPKRERSRSRSPPRTPRVVVKRDRSNHQMYSHSCSSRLLTA